jgi:hypothetical protein
MKVGDLVMFCDVDLFVLEPVLVIETAIDCASGYDKAKWGPIEVALVMNDAGQHWVQFENLMTIDEVISESR